MAVSNGIMARRTTADNAFIFAIVTPLMQRAHSETQAAEMVFVDSTGNLDRHDLSVFMFIRTRPTVGYL